MTEKRRGKIGEIWESWGKIGGEILKFPWDFRENLGKVRKNHETSIGFDTDLVNKNGGVRGNAHGFRWNGGLNICNRRITCINHV